GHYGYTRHGSLPRPRSPPYYGSSAAPDTPLHSYSDSGLGATHHSRMPPSPTGHSPGTLQQKRHPDSDSESCSDHDRLQRFHPQDPRSDPYYRDRDSYHAGSSFHYSASHGGHGGHSGLSSYRDHASTTSMPYSSNPSTAATPNAPSAHSEHLPALAPRPPRTDESVFVKKESGSATPFRIQSARGTPKGPLPIEVQVSLLTSVLQHDPFNCAIRKTTQAWELISREQGIRARTCSRRFDNIIQASISGRDRPVGTEEQQATKKRLLEQLFEMMNQPQALKRMQKKRRYRSEDTDRKLLMETIRLNPFAQKVGQVAKAWEDVRDALGMKVHARQCIRRVNRMVKPYLLRERMYRGNIPPEMREANDDLVRQVIQLMRSSGQTSLLDDVRNSNDEDSGSGMSDSEDQEDADMDSPDKQDHREDDELEDDEDEDMAGRDDTASAPQQRKRSGDAGSRPSSSTPVSPSSAPASIGAGHSSTPSLSGPISGSLTAPATPAKRGRPKNPVPAPASVLIQQAGDRERSSISSTGPNDTQTKSSSAQEMEMHPHRNWDNANLEQRPAKPTSSGPDEHSIAAVASTAAAHGTPLSSPVSMTSPNLLRGDHGQGHGHARQYSHGQGGHEYHDAGEYMRPSKHARTDSRSLYEMPGPHGPSEPQMRDQERGPRYYPSQPILPPPTSLASSRAGEAYDRRGRSHDAAGSAPSGENDVSTQGHGPSAPMTAQQCRELVSELHSIRDYVTQLDERRHSEKDKQSTLLYTIEKMQHQLQQQQQQISQLQHHLRYGPVLSQGPPPTPPLSASSSSHQPPPSQPLPQGPPLSPHSHRYPNEPSLGSGYPKGQQERGPEHGHHALPPSSHHGHHGMPTMPHPASSQQPPQQPLQQQQQQLHGGHPHHHGHHPHHMHHQQHPSYSHSEGLHPNLRDREMH
ncbi:hypothetical protein BGW38_006045, partial [Lunasporangiospora selenospora]